MHPIRLAALTAAFGSLLVGCADHLARETAAPASISAPSTRERVETGTLDGAPYRITIPADWNGELVVNAHGYEEVGSL